MASSGTFILSLYYLYPLALYIVLSISLLVSRARHWESQSNRTLSHSVNVVFFLQALLSVLFVAGLGLATSDFVGALRHHGEKSGIAEASVVGTDRASLLHV